MRVLITGGTNGMGKGLAQVLAQRDHEVVILGRSAERCAATVREIRERTGNPHVSSVTSDLTRLAEVRAAVDEIVERFPSLDGLFVNAGLGYAPARVPTPDGLDPHFQVNYLAHFLLTLHLLPLLERSEHGGRVVFNVFDGGELDLDDLQLEKGWGYERAVTQGMVAKRMFLVRMHELTRAQGRTGAAFIGFQIPKTVWSNQLQIIPLGMRMMATVAKVFGQFISIERSGEIMAPLFTDERAATLQRSGKVLTWKGGAFTELAQTGLVRDAKRQDRLWRESVRLCADAGTTALAGVLTGSAPQAISNAAR